MCFLSTPKVPAPPKPPEIPQAPKAVDQGVLNARARERRRSASAFGSTATILTGGRGLTDGASTTATTLLANRGRSAAADIREAATDTPPIPTTTITPDEENGGIGSGRAFRNRRRRGFRPGVGGSGSSGGGSGSSGGTLLGGGAGGGSGSGVIGGGTFSNLFELR